MVIVLWPARRRPAAEAPAQAPAYTGNARRIDWGRIRWKHWEDPQSGVSLDYPAIWRPDRLLDAFLQQPLADLKRAPIVGFRESTPVVIYRYSAPAPLELEAWLRKVETVPALREEFGSQVTARGVTTVSGRPALAVQGIGATRGALWNYRSLFFASKREAYRVTAGADQRDWQVIAPIFDRLLGSVRFAPRD